MLLADKCPGKPLPGPNPRHSPSNQRLKSCPLLTPRCRTWLVTPPCLFGRKNRLTCTSNPHKKKPGKRRPNPALQAFHTHRRRAIAKSCTPLNISPLSSRRPLNGHCHESVPALASADSLIRSIRKSRARTRFWPTCENPLAPALSSCAPCSCALPPRDNSRIITKKALTFTAKQGDKESVSGHSA